MPTSATSYRYEIKYISDQYPFHVSLYYLLHRYTTELKQQQQQQQQFSAPTPPQTDPEPDEFSTSDIVRNCKLYCSYVYITFLSKYLFF